MSKYVEIKIAININGKTEVHTAKMEEGMCFQNNGDTYSIKDGSIWNSNNQKVDSIKMTKYQFNIFEALANNVKEDREEGIVLSNADIKDKENGALKKWSLGQFGSDMSEFINKALYSIKGTHHHKDNQGQANGVEMDVMQAEKTVATLKFWFDKQNDTKTESLKSAITGQSEDNEMEMYTVRAKDTLWSISQKLGVSVDSLKIANNLTDESVQEGQVLIIPDKSNTPPKSNISEPLEEFIDAVNNRKYIVIRQGDTLYNIAKRLGISEEILLTYNPLITDKEKINVMDELWIEAPKEKEEQEEQENIIISDTITEDFEKEAETAYQTILKNGTRKPVKDLKNVYEITGQHVVKKGETLSEIAIKYDIPMAVLKRDNNIKNSNTIKEGSVLKINYYVYEIQSHGTSEQVAKHIYKNQEQIDDLKLEIEGLNKYPENYNYTKGTLVRLPNNIIVQNKVQEVVEKSDSINNQNSNRIEKNEDFPKTYQGYKDALAMKESSNRLTKVNRYGYIGLYQFGEMQLADIGLYSESDKGYGRNDWKGIFKKNPYGITSKSDFLSSREKQDKVLAASMKKNWEYIKHFGLDKYIGKNYKGITITKSGLLAGVHLVGIGGVKDFLQQGIDKEDGNHVPVSRYIRDLGGYDIDEALV